VSSAEPCMQFPTSCHTYEASLVCVVAVYTAGPMVPFFCALIFLNLFIDNAEVPPFTRGFPDVVSANICPFEFGG
jgi:hypothetical protein